MRKALSLVFTIFLQLECYHLANGQPYRVDVEETIPTLLSPAMTTAIGHLAKILLKK